MAASDEKRGSQQIDHKCSSPELLAAHSNGDSDGAEGAADTKSELGWPSCWQDGTRRSAFLPYRSHTVLTNLQRGNIPTQSSVLEPPDLTLHHRAGQGEVSEEELEKGSEGADEGDGSGLTPLMWACFYGQLPTVQLLLRFGAKVNRVGPRGEAPLSLAAAGGHHDLVRVLLTAGARINHGDNTRNTALMFAAHGNHPHVVNELLLQGADITAVNDSDYTAFDIVAATGSKLAQIVMEKHILELLSDQESNSSP